MAAKRMRSADRSDLLKRYRERVHISAKWREEDGYDKLWCKLVDLYRGKHFQGKALNNEDRIAVNIAFATINVIAPTVSLNNPKLVVFSQKNEDALKATIIETVLNYWWGRYDFQEELALAVKDYLVVGHGWLKVGWRYVEEIKAVQAAETAADADDGSSDAALTPEDTAEKPADEPDDAEVDADPEYEVTQDRPFVERVSWDDIFVNPEAKTLLSADWIAQRMVKSLAEVKQDKRYRQKARACLTPDSQQDKRFSKNMDDLSDDVQRVTLWEFYDMRMGTMCVFSEKGDELLLDPIPQPYAFGHPFVMLRNYEVPDMFYPMGDVEALEPLQDELNKTRSQLMNQRKRYNRKFLIREDAFDAAGISALQDDTDNVLVPVVDTDNPLQDLIIPLPQTSIDAQMFQYIPSLLADMDRISGVAEFQRGETSPTRKTATEASMINDAASSRAQDKLGSIEKMIGKVAQRVIQLAQQYMTQDTEVRVLGKNGFPVWIPFSRQDVQGEYDFSVEAGSTQPLNESQRRSQALQLLQTFTPYASAGLVNVQELIRYTLAYGFGIKNPDKFMMGQSPQQAPGEQAKSPKQSLIETMNYKDTPPDIQRQLEAGAGLTPSTVGGSSPGELSLGKVAPAMAGQQQQAVTAQQGMQASALSQLSSQQHAATQQTSQHAHEASMHHEKTKHEFAKGEQAHAQQILQGVAQAHQGAAASAQGAQQQADATDQQAAHAQAGQVMGAALAPQPETTADTDE